MRAGIFAPKNFEKKQPKEREREREMMEMWNKKLIVNFYIFVCSFGWFSLFTQNIIKLTKTHLRGVNNPYEIKKKLYRHFILWIFCY